MAFPVNEDVQTGYTHDSGQAVEPIERPCVNQIMAQFWEHHKMEGVVEWPNPIPTPSQIGSVFFWPPHFTGILSLIIPDNQKRLGRWPEGGSSTAGPFAGMAAPHPRSAQQCSLHVHTPQ